MSSSSSATAPTRGQYLREINRLSTEILTAQETLKTATDTLLQESQQKQLLIEKISTAESELQSVEKTKAMESVADGELVTLQRAVASMTAKRQDFIRLTKAARTDRDNAREESLSLYYQRHGMELEHIIATQASHSSPLSSVPSLLSTGIWNTDILKLYSEVENLWKRTSNQGIITRELVDTCLFFNELQLNNNYPTINSNSDTMNGNMNGNTSNLLGDDTNGFDSSSNNSTTTKDNNKHPPNPALQTSTLGTAVAYFHAGSTVASLDCKKAIETINDIMNNINSLVQKSSTLCTDALTLTEEDINENIMNGISTAYQSIQLTLQSMLTNCGIQLVLLNNIQKALDPSLSSKDSNESTMINEDNHEANDTSEAKKDDVDNDNEEEETYSQKKLNKSSPRKTEIVSNGNVGDDAEEESTIQTMVSTIKSPSISTATTNTTSKTTVTTSSSSSPSSSSSSNKATVPTSTGNPFGGTNTTVPVTSKSTPSASSSFSNPISSSVSSTNTVTASSVTSTKGSTATTAVTSKPTVSSATTRTVSSVPVVTTKGKYVPKVESSSDEGSETDDSMA